ncbi:hypothetical protein D3C71_1585090 [compost metagenome]
MLAKQLVCSASHGVMVKRMKHPAHTPGVHARAHRRLEQYIGITPCDRTGPCVKVVGHGLCPLHSNVRREKGVGAPHPGRRGALEGGVEVHHLHQSMDTRIGATRTQGADRMGRKPAERRFELVLHRVARQLALPTAVRLAVIADPQGHPCHGVAWEGAA